MTPCGPSSRPDPVFAALPLGEPLGGRVHRRAVEALAEEAGVWRFARPEGLHLTLFFAGRLAGAEREAFAAALREELAGQRGPRLLLRGGGAFVDHGRPRVLFIGLDLVAGAQELQNLVGGARRAALRAGVASEALARSEGRPFRPHVTVARPRRGRRGTGLPAAFGALDLSTVFQPREACLFVSERGEGPARYRSLVRIALLGGED